MVRLFEASPEQCARERSQAEAAEERARAWRREIRRPLALCLGWMVLGLGCISSLACNDSTGSSSLLTGRWSGSNTSFRAFTVDIRQMGDSITGSGEFIPAIGDPSGPRPLFGHAVGDSVSVRWIVPPSTGFALMQFDGRRTGMFLTGVTAGGSRIVLARE